MISINRFRWTENNIAHIARHQVTFEEAEEVFDAPHYLRRVGKIRYTALGRTNAGRYLFVGFDYSEQEVYVVTARSMSYKEKNLYQREV